MYVRAHGRDRTNSGSGSEPRAQGTLSVAGDRVVLTWALTGKRVRQFQWKGHYQCEKWRPGMSAEIVYEHACRRAAEGPFTEAPDTRRSGDSSCPQSQEVNGSLM